MNKQYTCLGMMSGTSGDGVDASIINSNGLESLKIIKEKYYEYDTNIFKEFRNLKKKINTIADLKNNSSSINELENKITIFHAKVIKDISFKINLDLIGFHGQTLFHSPQDKISLQLGNGNLLSQLSNKKIVYNFRKNDILNGGEGAPLSPIFHKHLIKSKKIDLPACVLNIGGISNLTFLKDFNDLNIISRDIGPGNCLIDNWVQTHTNKKYDVNGEISSRGEINKIILEQALEIHENNFKKKDNISFDTNDFDISFIRGLSLEDGAATLIAFTAKLVSSKIDEILKEYNNEKIKILICGGGRKNLNLVKHIKLSTKKNLFFHIAEDFNLNGDFIESRAFAYLAIRSVLSLPISFPLTTGCNAPCTGGEII